VGGEHGTDLVGDAAGRQGSVVAYQSPSSVVDCSPSRKVGEPTRWEQPLRGPQDKHAAILPVPH
jgi:hypothetical protein